MLKKITQWFRSLFKKTKTVEQENEKIPEYWTGSWKLSVLLDRLPEYHAIMHKARKWRNSSIGSVMRMGPTIIGGEGGNCWLSKDDKHVDWSILPTQFFVSWGDPGEDDDKVQPTLLAGLKVEVPYNVQKQPGDCYTFLFYYKEYNFWVQGHFFVRDKSVYLAKERRVVQRHIRRNGKPPIQIPFIVWDNPLQRFFNEDKDKPETEEILLLLFRSMLLWWAERDKRWLVITKQDSHRVSFSVEEGRHTYFFRDREKTVTTPTGKRKTIFHICSEHYRTYKSGRRAFVKEHCRGIRHFFWKDCETHIFAPGWHGQDAFKLLDVTTFEDDSETPKGVDAAGFAEKLARVMEGTNVR